MRETGKEEEMKWKVVSDQEELDREGERESGGRDRASERV